MSCTPFRLTYDKLGILLTNSPGYKQGGSQYKNLIRVQDFTYSFSHPEVNIKEIGSDNLVMRDGESPILKQPEVQCNINYLFCRGENERALGFRLSSSYSILKNFFDAYSTDDINIVAVAAEGRGHTDLNLISTDRFEGHNVIGLGNCFLTNYTYNAAIGRLPECSVSYASSNMKFDKYDSTDKPTLPSIKLGMDNQFSPERITLTSNSFNEKVYDNINAIMPGDIKIKIQKFAGNYGGVPLESLEAAVQNISINVPIKRQDIYGFGSNYVFDRKLKLPIIASADMELIIREFSQGQIESFFSEGAKYEIIVQQDYRNYKEPVVNVMNLQIDNAQLKSQSFQNQIGGQSTTSVGFTFGVSAFEGFKMYS